MARINYQFEKRQRELAKKKKKEEKRRRKLGLPPEGDENADTGKTEKSSDD